MLACKGGKKLYSGYWYFKELVGCTITDEIKQTRIKFQDKVLATVLTYVYCLEEMSQYPASHCKMKEDIVMYGHSGLSGNESMNGANQCALQHIAIWLMQPWFF